MLRMSLPRFTGTVRPYEASYATKVKAFFEAVSPTDGPALETACYAFVAEQEGRVHGLALARRNTIHPYTLTLALAVPPAGWSDGTADALFAELKAAIPDRPWRFQALEPHASQAFLQRHRFFKVRRTWTPTLDVASSPHALLADARVSALQLGFDLGPLGRGVDDAALMDDLAGAHLEHYATTHRVNPAAPRPLPSWRDRFLGDDLDPDAAFLARQNGAVAAFASLRPGDAGVWEVAWFGTLASHRTHAFTLNLALKHHEMELAWWRGITQLGFEVDSTDPEAVAVLDALTEVKGEALVTYQTGIPR